MIRYLLVEREREKLIKSYHDSEVLSQTVRKHCKSRVRLFFSSATGN